MTTEWNKRDTELKYLTEAELTLLDEIRAFKMNGGAL